MLKIGVIGLGNMGSEIACRLSKKYSVYGFDLDEGRLSEIKKRGVTPKYNLIDLAEEVECLVLSLPNSDISVSVLTEIKDRLKSNSIIVETSTVLPSEINRYEKLFINQKVEIIDAAILGGVENIRNGDAKFLIGGDDSTVKKIDQLFVSLGREYTILGPKGAGMAGKIINNAIAHNVMVMIIEAASLGVKSGIKSENLLEIFNGKTAYHRPVNHRFQERILEKNYEGGMSTKNATKDSRLALELAQNNNIPLYSIQASHTAYEIAVGEDLGELDYSSLATLWEKWCNIEFK